MRPLNCPPPLPSMTATAPRRPIRQTTCNDAPRRADGRRRHHVRRDYAAEHGPDHRRAGGAGPGAPSAARGERGQAKADRRVVEESITALTDAGLFKIAVPRRYGGYKTSVRTMLEVSAAVAEADGGTACVLTLVNVCSWLIGLFPQQAQDDVFGADPAALVSGVLAPTAATVKVEGGWRVTGKWYYNSGSWHATGPASASRSPTPTGRWSTRDWRSSRAATSASRTPGSSPA